MNDLTRVILDCELNQYHWTLMHRYHKAADIINELLDGFYQVDLTQVRRSSLGGRGARRGRECCSCTPYGGEKGRGEAGRGRRCSCMSYAGEGKEGRPTAGAGDRQQMGDRGGRETRGVGADAGSTPAKCPCRVT